MHHSETIIFILNIFEKLTSFPFYVGHCPEKVCLRMEFTTKTTGLSTLATQNEHREKRQERLALGRPYSKMETPCTIEQLAPYAKNIYHPAP
jgi:hypothetical protein